MSVFDLNIPNLNVNVNSDINKTLVVLRQPATTLNRSSIPIQSVAESAITASYAVTASHALNVDVDGFAITGSNTFTGGQYLEYSTNAINLNVEESEPHIEILATVGSESAEYHTYQLFQYSTSSGYFGFTLDTVRAGYSGWDGPSIAGDDGVFNYPAFIGFQDARNYTDGRVTILKPLIVSGSINTTGGIVTPFVATDGALEITTAYGTTASSTWMFTAEGNLLFPDGTTQSTAAAGGNANTGDVTFNGVQIIGAGTASGDGNGYSTLELVPDVNLYGTDQYIIVDPTAPGHIHLRAGGAQDGSGADLFLGAERTHVKVNDNAGVKLSNDAFPSTSYPFQVDVDYDEATWTTDESDNHFVDITITNPSAPSRSSTPFSAPFYNFHQYPENILQVYDGSEYYYLTYDGYYNTMGNPYQLRIQVKEAPPTNPTTLTSLDFTIYTLTSNYLSLEYSGLDIGVTNNIDIYTTQDISLYSGTGSVSITANDNESAPTWTFGVNGTLEFPDATVQTTAFTGIPQGTISASAQISQSGFVSSSTINTIQTITSASYAAITPVSGTLYIVIN